MFYEFHFDNVDIFTDLTKSGLSDVLTDTVNYAAAVKLIRRVFTAEKNNLIERAAQRVCDALFDEFPAVDSVRILLKKPEAPVSAEFEYVGVEIERSRAKKIS